MTVTTTTAPAPAGTTPTAVVEIHDGERWHPVVPYAHLTPGRGVPVLVDGAQIALFRDHAGSLHALAHRDPFSGAHVMARGLLGSRGGVPVLVSPMYKQAFDLRTGECLDEATAPDGTEARLRVWRVRVE
ncbi:nitrite reductase (NAD(P)H) small subunit [Streptomyces sp. SID11385]|uniref:nitrite reductase (NAD(P)H) small subunit n=1 Tax=Streptomyces sp. SID11385 TaxID=2706031 RepID=UPI0013CD037A|nr:nitrite reductase (NAD(P)H) small subunit [Streptomyces sp. SID11385]NEA43724.1 nitrite reductase (NAD(P)H) small subunit [Streptomyces sp. SID11385]